MKAIAFDAFGTLFKVKSGGSAKKIIYNIVAENKSVDEHSFVEEWIAYYKRYTSGGGFFTERDIFVSRIQMFYDRYKIDRSAKADADALLADAFERVAYEEVRAVIKELKKQYQVFIGSNTDNDVLEAVMEKNGITVHKVYTSEDLKCYKPCEAFFRQILEDNGLQPQEVMFVGDSISDDILGPKALGMTTVWVDRNRMGGEHGQDYTVSDLNELLEVLKCPQKQYLSAER